MNREAGAETGGEEEDGEQGSRKFRREMDADERCPQRVGKGGVERETMETRSGQADRVGRFGKLQVSDAKCEEKFLRVPGATEDLPSAICDDLLGPVEDSEPFESEEVIDSQTILQAAAVRISRGDSSEAQDLQEIFERTVESSGIQGGEQGICLLFSVLPDDRTCKGPLDARSHTHARQGSSKTFRHQTLDYRSGSDEVAGEDVLVGDEAEKDRSDGRSTHEARPRANSTDRAAGKHHQRSRSLSFDRRTIERGSVPQDERLPGQHPRKQEGGWCRVNDCVQESQGKVCSKENIDGESGRAVRAQARIVSNEGLHSESGQSREKCETPDDGVMQPKERTIKALKINLLTQIAPSKLIEQTLSSYDSVHWDTTIEDLETSLKSQAGYRCRIDRGRRAKQVRLGKREEEGTEKREDVDAASEKGSETRAAERATENQEESQSSRMNPPAVETIRWAKVLPYAPAQARKIIRVILNFKEFQKQVLKQSKAKPALLRPCSIDKATQEELKALRYVKKAKRRPRMICSIFTVLRPDGKERLIWDGRMLNEQCHPPPRFHFRTLSEQLRWLLKDGSNWFASFDFKSWFVQLKPVPQVAAFFGARLHDGIYILAGIPMGWSWAPIIAQLTSEAIVRRMILKLAVKPIAVIVYIDNVIMIFAGPARRKEKMILGTVLAEARECGVVIKESSILVGERAPWLGLEVDAIAQAFRLKPTFIEKVIKAWKQAQDCNFVIPVRAWYTILSCLIHLVWTSQEALAVISRAIEWMAELGSTTASGDWEAVGSTSATAFPSIHKELLDQRHP